MGARGRRRRAAEFDEHKTARKARRRERRASNPAIAAAQKRHASCRFKAVARRWIDHEKSRRPSRFEGETLDSLHDVFDWTTTTRNKLRANDPRMKQIRMAEKGEIPEELWYKRPRAQTGNDGGDGKQDGAASEGDGDLDTLLDQMEGFEGLAGLEVEEEDMEEDTRETGGVLVPVNDDELDDLV
ncbi:MAG: hypothetical protein Q9183_001836 [Haloplaca sp. 2 TL-2023]